MELGTKGRDKVTGFEGICMGTAQYLTGCNQILLVPTHLDEKGKRLDGEWFDDIRIEQTGALVEFSGMNAAAEKPGCDESPPPGR